MEARLSCSMSLLIIEEEGGMLLKMWIFKEEDLVKNPNVAYLPRLY